MTETLQVWVVMWQGGESPGWKPYELYLDESQAMLVSQSLHECGEHTRIRPATLTFTDKEPT